MTWRLSPNLTAMSIVAACLILAGGTVVGAHHSFKYLGWIAVFPVAGFLFADYMGAHLIFFAHKERGTLGWSALVCKFLIFGTLLLNGGSLVYLLITESKDKAAQARKTEEAKARTEILTAAKVKLIEAESAARRAEDSQRAENAARLAAATGNARLARTAMTARQSPPVVAVTTPTPAPTPEENEAKDDGSSFERIIRWYTRAPLYFSGGLVGLICFVLMQTFGKIAADRKAPAGEPTTADEFPDEIDANERLSLSLSQKRERLSLSDLDRKAARKKLLGHLKLIAFNHPKRWFKADLVRGGVTIRMFKREHGHELAIAETTQSDKLLASVDRPDFREKLKKELIYQGFPLDVV